MKKYLIEASQTFCQDVIVEAESIGDALEAARRAEIRGELNVLSGWEGSSCGGVELSDGTPALRMGGGQAPDGLQHIVQGQDAVMLCYRRDSRAALTEDEARTLIEWDASRSDGKPEKVERILSRFHEGYIPGPWLHDLALSLGMDAGGMRLNDIELADGLEPVRVPETGAAGHRKLTPEEEVAGLSDEAMRLAHHKMEVRYMAERVTERFIDLAEDGDVPDGMEPSDDDVRDIAGNVMENYDPDMSDRDMILAGIQDWIELKKEAALDPEPELDRGSLQGILDKLREFSGETPSGDAAEMLETMASLREEIEDFLERHAGKER